MFSSISFLGLVSFATKYVEFSPHKEVWMPNSNYWKYSNSAQIMPMFVHIPVLMVMHSTHSTGSNTQLCTNHHKFMHISPLLTNQRPRKCDKTDRKTERHFDIMTTNALRAAAVKTSIGFQISLQFECIGELVIEYMWKYNYFANVLKVILLLALSLGPSRTIHLLNKNPTRVTILVNSWLVNSVLLARSGKWSKR